MDQPAPITENATHGQYFAHLSDLHLTTLANLQFRELFNKRLLGYLSWRWRRRHEHRGEVVEALIRDLRNNPPQNILITGDLTHLGTVDECREVLAWLQSLGKADQITVVPGNHDTYAPVEWPDSVGLWSEYMASDHQSTGGHSFPFLRRRGPVGLIGVNTARPTAPFLATGRLGTAQLLQLERLLQEARQEGLFRVVLMHHPPSRQSIGRRKALDDATALGRVILRAGAELVVHGHAHRPLRSTLPGPSGPIPVIGAPSASALGGRPGTRAAYYRYRVTPASSAWRLTVEVRSYDPEQARFRYLEDYEIMISGNGHGYR